MNDDLAIVTFLSKALAPDPRPETVRFLRDAMGSGQTRWERIVQVANEHFVTPALWSETKANGLADALPEDLATYLVEIHRLNTERNRGIARQVREAVRILNTAGIEPLLLKGVAHLFCPAFPDDGARIMADIDLLVPEEAVREAVSALEQVGYCAEPGRVEDLQNHHHYAPLLRIGEPASIELHGHVLIERCQHLLPNELAWSNSEPVPDEELRMRVMTPTYRVLHGLVHAQITDLGHLRGSVQLRPLHDMAAMATKFEPNVEWPEIRYRMERGSHGRTFKGAAGLLSSLFDVRAVDHLATGFSHRFHTWRCRRRLGSESFRMLDDRLQNFSAYKLDRRFGLPDGPFPLLRARLRYGYRLLTRGIDEAQEI